MIRKLFINHIGIIIAIIILTILLSYKLISVPPGINGDEASIGYNAVLVSKTLRDETGRLTPPFVATFDYSDWKQPVTFYSNVFFFKIFGPSYFILRFVSVLYAISGSILLYLISNIIFNKRVGLIISILFILTPAIVIQSHLGLENIAPVPFVLAWILFLLLYEKENKLIYLILSGFMVGISFYSYLGMRLIAPVFGILTVIYIYKKSVNRKQNLKKIVFFVLGILPFVAIIPLLNVKYPGAILNRNNPKEIRELNDIFLPYLSNYDISFLYLTGDKTDTHSTGKTGIYLIASLPLFLLGVYKALQSRSKFPLFLLIVFFTGPFLFGLVGELYRGSRIIALIPFYYLIVGYSVRYLTEKSILEKYKLIVFVIIIAVLLNFSYFIRDYWYDYPGRIRELFSKESHKAFDEANKIAKLKNIKLYLQKELIEEESYATKFFTESTLETYQVWEVGRDLPDNATVVTKSGVLDNFTSKNLEKTYDGYYWDVYYKSTE